MDWSKMGTLKSVTVSRGNKGSYKEFIKVTLVSEVRSITRVYSHYCVKLFLSVYLYT